MFYFAFQKIWFYLPFIAFAAFLSRFHFIILQFPQSCQSWPTHFQLRVNLQRHFFRQRWTDFFVHTHADLLFKRAQYLCLWIFYWMPLLSYCKRKGGILSGGWIRLFPPYFFTFDPSCKPLGIPFPPVLHSSKDALAEARHCEQQAFEQSVPPPQNSFHCADQATRPFFCSRTIFDFIFENGCLMTTAELNLVIFNMC